MRCCPSVTYESNDSKFEWGLTLLWSFNTQLFHQGSTHLDHVSISPTDGIGPTQGQRKTLTMVGFEPTTFRLDPPTELQGQNSNLES